MKKIAYKINGFIRFSSILFLFSILISGFASVHSVQATTVTVSVFPSTVTASVGQNFSISVTVSSVLDLYGWEFKLNWTASLLDVINVTEGSFLKAGGSTFFTYKVNATAGRIVVDCTLLGSAPGVDGKGTLATITFYVKSADECPLNLYDGILLNSLEQLIPCQTVSGYGYFTPPHDVAITSVSVSPTIVLPSDIVDINVTVQNQGGFTEAFNVTVYANSQAIGVQSVSLESGFSTTITFMWDTTGFGKGDYEISAAASIVQGEADTADNTVLADKVVTILYLGHDIAVKGIMTSKTIVGQGYCMSIAASVKNYGIFNESFDATAYANTTIIQTQTVTLTSGCNTILTFTWNSTGFAKGNYTISAVADTVPGETDTADNTRIDGNVTVAVVGDVNADGKVDLKDVYAVAKAYGSFIGHPKYNPNYDINCDGKIDLKDYYTTCKNYGKTDP